MSLKFKRYYPIILLLAAVLGVFGLVLGDQRIIAYTVKAAGTEMAESELTETYDISNEVALFDDGLVHSVQVLMDEDDYEEMLTTYQETGLKEYFRVDVVIDGVQIDDVGIRLKGNASLRSALGGNGGGMGGFGGGGGGMGGPGGGGAPGGAPGQAADGETLAEGEEIAMQLPEGAEAPDVSEWQGLSEDGERPEPPQGGGGPGGGGFGGGSSQESGETKIPFMIKFDAFVDGQTYQGYTAIALRTYGTSWDEAMLQEPVTNAVARMVGLAATRTAYTGLQINSDDETLYVISEVVNEEYLADNFAYADGVLYKAEVGSTLDYEGEDPSSYADSFTQQTRVNDADLAPLIAFMRFLDQADDETFEAELPGYLDVDGFATYLALNVMMVNTDSIIGMNNNYYLYYDDQAEQFTVMLWDTNESLGKLGGSASYGLDITSSSAEGGGPGGGGFGGGRGGGGMGGENSLTSRFLANDTFKALYEEKLALIYQQAFASNAINELVDEYSQLVHEASGERSLVDLDNYETAVDEVLTFIDERYQYLASSDLLADSKTKASAGLMIEE